MVKKTLTIAALFIGSIFTANAGENNKTTDDAKAEAPVAILQTQDDDPDPDQQLHWFDSNNLSYLGQRTVAAQQAICGTTGLFDCADGYTAVSGTSPAGSYVTSATRNTPN